MGQLKFTRSPFINAMNENKVKTVMLCVLCEDAVCDHDEFLYKGYQCQLCLHVHSLNSEANRCCMELTSKLTCDSSHFAKEKKGVKKEAEIPVASLQGRRDK